MSPSPVVTCFTVSISNRLYHYMAGNNVCLLISTTLPFLRPSAASQQLEHHGRQLFCVSPLGGTLRIWICAGMHSHSVRNVRTDDNQNVFTTDNFLLLFSHVLLISAFRSNVIDTWGASIFRKLPTYFGIINTICEPKVRKSLK